MTWEHFPHQADMGIRGRGASREEAFEQAAVALTAVITDPEGVEPLVGITVLTADDIAPVKKELAETLFHTGRRRQQG